MPTPSPLAPSDTADHVWFVEEREYARHEARRGRRHAFEHLDPRRTALVVIDVVPFFVRESAYVRGIVPRVNLLAAGLRAAGHPRWSSSPRGTSGRIETPRLIG